MKTTGVIILYVCNLEIRKSVTFTYNLNLNNNCLHTVLYAECSYNTVLLPQMNSTKPICVRVNYSIFPMSAAPTFLWLPSTQPAVI